MIAKAKANNKGDYQIKIPAQKAGTILTLFSTMNGKAFSNALTIKVKDKTAPKVTHITITNKTKKITIKTEKDAVIKLTIGDKTYTQKANKLGTYTFTVNKIKVDMPWNITVTDAAGNTTKISGKV